ncbi:MAG TPA: 5'-deoxynucleotidase [Clostridia bacterium]|jgi:5'-deoxynucleotidase|nr:5'-deoxynucleotidase [Clostridia bacterium]
MAIKRFNFFAMISRMKLINRWGLMRNTQSENIQEHSLQVAIIAHALAMTKNEFFGGSVDTDKIAVFAMFHDANEILTGDLPTPIKYYNPEISKAYKDVEYVSKAKLLSMLPDKLKEKYSEIFYLDEETVEYKIVKAADRLSAYIKCVEEVKAGNNEFKKAGESILESINAIEMPEVKYFQEHFIQGFFLSLDELN